MRLISLILTVMEGYVSTVYYIHANAQASLSLKIKHEDFRHAMRLMGFEMSDSDFSEFVDSYDPRGEGVINYRDFNNNV